MQTTIEEIISSYKPSTIEETKAIIREIVQSIVLIGLGRSNFFKIASFYGGTALRIFYNLNRYSEDLDFTLNEVNDNFSITPYISKIQEVALSYGLNLEISTKIKTANIYQTFINLKINSKMIATLHKDENIKVKLEIDCHPAIGFKTENKWLDMLEFAPIVVLDEPSLFAGKLHAILCRNYKNTVKGRDYYDFLFYIKNKIKPNMNYLKNKLVESGKIKEDMDFNIDLLKVMLKQRFEITDFEQVKKDAMRFVFKNEDLSYYCKELFMQMVDKLQNLII